MIVNIRTYLLGSYHKMLKFLKLQFVMQVVMFLNPFHRKIHRLLTYSGIVTNDIIVDLYKPHVEQIIADKGCVYKSPVKNLWKQFLFMDYSY